MRYIPLETLKKRVPKDWLKDASKVDASLVPLGSAARKSIIDKDERWQSLRKIYSKFSNGKCWYCESKIKRSPKPIDHYRPKCNVAEDRGHGGYWWLAYKWENYRLACSHCNSFGSAASRGVAGGKADHFPLLDPTRRATQPRKSPDHPDPLDQEQPLILDPTRDADPALIWFDPNGSVSAHPEICADPNGYLYKKATESIRILGLQQDELVELRGAHCKQILDVLGEADDLVVSANYGDPTACKQLNRRVRALRLAMGPKAEYSAATRAALMAKRGSSKAVEIVLSN
jgi:uncharacterized protein (TIGR02646 family)